MCLTAWNEPMMRSNCLRSLAYSTAIRSPFWAAPRASAARGDPGRLDGSPRTGGAAAEAPGGAQVDAGEDDFGDPAGVVDGLEGRHVDAWRSCVEEVQAAGVFQQESVRPGGVGQVEHGAVDPAVSDRRVENRRDQGSSFGDPLEQVAPAFAVFGAGNQQRRQDTGRVEVHRRRGAADLLGGDRRLLHPEFRTAEVHGDQEPGDPLVAELAVDRLVAAGVRVHRAADAIDAHVLCQKTGNRVSEQLLRLRQSKVHVGGLRVARRRPVSARAGDRGPVRR